MTLEEVKTELVTRVAEFRDIHQTALDDNNSGDADYAEGCRDAYSIALAMLERITD